MSTLMAYENTDITSLKTKKFALGQVAALSSLHLWTIFSPLFGVSYSTSELFILNDAVEETVSKLSRLALTLFVVVASGDSLEEIGYRRPQLDSDILALAVVGVGHIGLISLGKYLIHTFPPSAYQTAASFGRMIAAERSAFAATPLWIVGLLCAVTGLAEETFYRGFLISRLRLIFGSVWPAVAVQAMFFGLVHSHQGFGGMVTLALSGAVYGVAFVYVRSIWPIAIVHALYDFWIYYHLFVATALRP